MLSFSCRVGFRFVGQTAMDASAGPGVSRNYGLGRRRRRADGAGCSAAEMRGLCPHPAGSWRPAKSPRRDGTLLPSARQNPLAVPQAAAAAMQVIDVAGAEPLRAPRRPCQPLCLRWSHDQMGVVAQRTTAQHGHLRGSAFRGGNAQIGLPIHVRKTHVLAVVTAPGGMMRHPGRLSLFVLASGGSMQHEGLCRSEKGGAVAAPGLEDIAGELSQVSPSAAARSP